MDKPSKLFTLKQWVTIPEAAQYLGVVFGEAVSEADVLRLGLDGHLTLSVRFVNFTQANRYRERTQAELQELARDYLARLAEMEEAKAANQPHPGFVTLVLPPLEEEFEQIITLRDDEVYDLPLIGAERIDVERQYQVGVMGPDVTRTNIFGTFVDSQDGVRYQLRQLPAKYPTTHGVLTTADMQPAWALPEDSVLVVRTAALREFQQRLSDCPVAPPAETPRCPATWEQVSVSFISEHKVQVKVGASLLPAQNYAETGFEDKRTPGKTNAAWQALLELAERRGTLSVPIKDRSRVEKRMQEIRKALRAYLAREGFDIPPDSDPLEYDKHSSEYRARFEIGTTPSFDA